MNEEEAGKFQSINKTLQQIYARVFPLSILSFSFTSHWLKHSLCLVLFVAHSTSSAASPSCADMSDGELGLMCVSLTYAKRQTMKRSSPVWNLTCRLSQTHYPQEMFQRIRTRRGGSIGRFILGKYWLWMLCLCFVVKKRKKTAGRRVKGNTKTKGCIVLPFN